VGEVDFQLNSASGTLAQELTRQLNSKMFTEVDAIADIHTQISGPVFR